MAAGSTYPVFITDANGHETLGSSITFTDAAVQPGGDSAIVTDVAAPPSTFVTPLVFDHTGTTGGLYAWTGSAYIQVGLATS